MVCICFLVNICSNWLQKWNDIHKIWSFKLTTANKIVHHTTSIENVTFHSAILYNLKVVHFNVNFTWIWKQIEWFVHSNDLMSIRFPKTERLIWFSIIGFTLIFTPKHKIVSYSAIWYSFIPKASLVRNGTCCEFSAFVCNKPMWTDRCFGISIIFFWFKYNCGGGHGLDRCKKLQETP